jgi:hypothetical protein
VRGFYFICKDKTGEENRYWMGEGLDAALRKFDNFGDKYLNEHNRYFYTIDFCLGYDIKGCLAWSNIDFSEKFIDCSTCC